MSKNTKISEIVDNLLDGMHGISKSETIVGEPQQAGDATVIPVHRLRVAFGAASAEAGGKSSRVGGDSGIHGAGGAVELDPLAAIAIGKDGHAHLLTVEADSGTSWSKLVEQVPELLTSIALTLGERVSEEVKKKALPEDQRAKQLGEGRPSEEPAERQKAERES